MLTRTVARNVRTFANELGHFIDGLDDRGMVSCTGHIHRVFEADPDRLRQAIQGAADISLDLLKLSADFLVGLEVVAPLSPHRFHEAFVLRVDLADLLGVEVHQSLGLILAEPKFSKGGGKTQREPQLSDLRESGAIEQDADMVIFLYKPSEGEIMQDSGLITVFLQ